MSPYLSEEEGWTMLSRVSVAERSEAVSDALQALDEAHTGGFALSD